MALDYGLPHGFPAMAMLPCFDLPLLLRCVCECDGAEHFSLLLLLLLSATCLVFSHQDD